MAAKPATANSCCLNNLVLLLSAVIIVLTDMRKTKMAARRGRCSYISTVCIKEEVAFNYNDELKNT